MGIGRLHRLKPGKGADQHEQGRFRQVEIGHQHIDSAEAVTRGDEDGGIALERLYLALRRGGAFEQPQTGCADADDAAAGGVDGIQGRGGIGGDHAPFGVHPVVGRVVGLDRQEGAGPDMQGQGMGRDATGLQGLHQGRGEMQASRGCRDRPVQLREHGLVVREVTVVLGPLGRDIGRQGHDADGPDGVVERGACEVEAQGDETVFGLGRDGGGQALEGDTVAGLQTLARLHEGRPDIGCIAMMQGRLYGDGQGLALRPDTLAHSRQPRGDHPRVVEHQGVAGPQEVWQVADDMVLQRAVPHDQQACGIPRLGGAERDVAVGQVEVEIGGLHQAGQWPRGTGGVKLWCIP